MKVFIASLIILGVILATIIVNSFYIRSVSDKLCCELDAIPENSDEVDKDFCIEKAEKASEIWHSSRTAIGITVNSNDILEIDHQMTEMMTFLKNDSFEDAVTAKERLAEMIDHLKRLERISIDNVL